MVWWWIAKGLTGIDTVKKEREIDRTRTTVTISGIITPIVKARVWIYSLTEFPIKIPKIERAEIVEKGIITKSYKVEYTTKAEFRK